MLTPKIRVAVIAVVIIFGGLGLTLFLIVPSVCPTCYCQVQKSCFVPNTANYYNGILQLYPYNPSGHRWALELNPEQPPFNSGSSVVPVGNGWWTNQGPNLNNIRNEVSTPHFAANRPNLGVGGDGPYNQDYWRRLGYMDLPTDYKNIEATGLFYVPPWYSKAGRGPLAVDMVMRGGVQQSGTPYNCQAPSYHIALAFTGDDESSRLERDIDHQGGPMGGPVGYCKGCINGNELSGGKGLPIIGADKVFGFKTLVYNNIANTKVHIDVYLDMTGTGNHWQLLWSYVDQGGDPRIDSTRGISQCQGSRPELPVTWGGPVGSSFRINAAGVEFRQLTVQEIIPPQW